MRKKNKWREQINISFFKSQNRKLYNILPKLQVLANFPSSSQSLKRIAVQTNYYTQLNRASHKLTAPKS